MKMLFFIDGDNNITTGLNGLQHLTEEDTVLVFHSQGMALSKIRARCATSRAKVSFIESVKDGKNSVDFQIVAELGVRIGKNEVQFAYIISQDQGYVPSITMLKKCYGDMFCEIGLADSIESCLNLTFLLRTRSRLELYTSLCREYGDAKGDLVFNHLKELFEMPEVNFAPAPAAEAEPETLPESAAEPAEIPEEPVTETVPEPEPVPAAEEKEPEPAPAEEPAPEAEDGPAPA
ncbi:MAG: PIN domain-containing protein, partial [Lachnospiraceae bacterium]|nr:PIN domain-containing protein [Lachnospiraceae bacterium]